MSDDRKSYTVNIGGTEHTLLLTPEDAKRYEDAKPVAAKTAAPKAAEKPADKSRTVKNK